MKKDKDVKMFSKRFDLIKDLVKQLQKMKRLYSKTIIIGDDRDRLLTTLNNQLFMLSEERNLCRKDYMLAKQSAKRIAQAIEEKENKS